MLGIIREPLYGAYYFTAVAKQRLSAGSGGSTPAVVEVVHERHGAHFLFPFLARREVVHDFDLHGREPRVQ